MTRRGHIWGHISSCILLLLLPGMQLMAQTLATNQTKERYVIYPLSISSSFSEMGPAMGPEGQLLFSSNRPARSIIRRFNANNQQPFYQLWESWPTDLTTLSAPQAFAPQLRSPLNNGPLSFSADGRQMYLTRNSEGHSTAELDIILFSRLYDKWPREASSLPLKIRGYSIMHPAIAPDNERLYFASDMPGGYGGMDLYYSVRRGGFLSRPVNLGPKINSSGNEVFPFVDPEGRLFFASDGLPGAGGLDIFVSHILPNDFSPPLNLGAGLNSAADDFGFIWYQNEKSGYFVSNRQGGKGQDDLYGFEARQGLNLFLIEGKVTHAQTGEPLAEVDIQVLLPNQSNYQKTASAADGSFSLLLWGNETYTFTFNKEEFTPLRKTTAAKALTLPIVLSPLLTQQPEVPEEAETPKDSLLHLNNQWF